MSEIPFIDDQYIDQTIKSAGAYNPALNKTQGVKLRELIKRLRDRIEESNSDVVNVSGTQHITGAKSFTQISVEELSFIKNGFASLLRNPLNQSQNYIYTLPRESGEIALLSQLNKSQVELGNVNNTSDADKPISVATLQALRDKQNALNFSPENAANKAVSLDNPDHTRYPTTQAVADAINVISSEKANIKGENAMGRWPIDISGNSATANTSLQWNRNTLINDYITDINGAMIGFGIDGSWHYVSSLTVANEVRDYANGAWNISVNGNSATADLASNSSHFAGIGYEGTIGNAPQYAMMYNPQTSKWGAASKAISQSFNDINTGAVLNNAATSWGDATSQAQYSGDGTTPVNTYLMGYNVDGKWSPKSKLAVQNFIDVNNGATLVNSISGTSALSYNSAQWNGYDFDKSNAYSSGFDLIFGRTTGTNQARLISQEGMQVYVGVNPGGETLKSVLERDSVAGFSYDGVKTVMAFKNNNAPAFDAGTSISFDGYYKQSLISSYNNAQSSIGGYLRFQTYSGSISNTLNHGMIIAPNDNVSIGFPAIQNKKFAVNGDALFTNDVTAPNFIGNASSASKLDNGSSLMQFHWEGRSGQPTWLWGADGFENSYVYNPSNFNVNSAVSWGGRSARLNDEANIMFLPMVVDGSDGQAKLGVLSQFNSWLNINPGGETLSSILARGNQGNQGQSVKLQSTDPGNGYYELKNVLNSQGTSFRLISGVWGHSQDGFSIYNSRGTTPFFIAESGNTHIGYTSDQGYAFAVSGNSYFSNNLTVGNLLSTGALRITSGGRNWDLTGDGNDFLIQESGVNTWARISRTSGYATFTGSGRFNGSLVADGVFVGNSTGTFASDVTAPSFHANNWFRSTGATGWYNETWGGGICMSDAVWVRVYNGKSFTSDQTIQAGHHFETPGHYKCFGFKGMAGDYDTNGTTDKIVWTIGDNWNTIESMYGIGYSYKTKYVDGNHQMVFRQAGVVHASIDLDDGRAFFDGMVTTPILKATSKLLIPSTSGKQWSIYIQDN